MKKKKKWIMIVGILVIIGVLAMPILNLIIKPDRPKLSEKKLQDLKFKEVASILQNKCSDCHSTKTAYPWYSSLPGAKAMIQKDIQDGLAVFDMTKLLFSDTEQMSETALAKLEFSTKQNTMPPSKYVFMHWDYALTKSDEKKLLSWVKHVRKTYYATKDIDEKFQEEPVRPLPLSVKLNMEKVALGDKLFHDKRLSSDNTLSCASCHGLDKGGTDQRQFSIGVKGQVGGINAPTVFNASYNVLQFWDGRANDLVEQADGPVNNPIEMGSNWKQAIAKIKNDPYYITSFKKLYNGKMTGLTICDAIATFEKNLITPNGKFDKYLRGNISILSQEEKDGYKLFVEVGCATCHAGPALGGEVFEKMGKFGNYFTDRGNIKKEDYGRFGVTQKEQDRYKFKVPILRNIAITYPYFHDGSIKDLKKAIKLMGQYQLGKALKEKEISLIEKFLNTLTGEYKGKLLK